MIKEIKKRKRKRKRIKEFSTVKLVKFGNSYYTRIPRSIIDKYKLNNGDYLTQRYDSKNKLLINQIPSTKTKKLMKDEKRIMDILEYYPIISKVSLFTKFSGGTRSEKSRACLNLAKIMLIKNMIEFQL